MTEVERAELNAAMARLAGGERGAFDAVYSGLWPVVRAACHRFFAEPADAEDAAQQTLLDLFAEAHRYDPARDVVGWAVTMAAWKSRTLRQKSARRREVGPEALSERSDLTAGLEEAVARREMLVEIDALVQGLPAIDRETIEAILSGDAPKGATHRKRRQRAWARLRAAWSHRHG